MNKKISILFIDDEQNVIEGLRRSLYPMKNEWDIYFETAGKNALKLIAEKEIDIIFSDMKMPEMDGAVLLEEIKKIKAGTIRIILSGYSDKDMIFRASKSAHQFLAKPCSPSLIKSTVEKVIYLRKYINNKNIAGLITGVEELPSIPELYIELEKEINSSTASLKKISEIISRDITMTAKILQLVNSSFFGLPQSTSNILQAINYLGLDVLKSLVLFVKVFCMKKIYTGNFSINEFWNHSLKVAKTSQQIVLSETADSKIADRAFIAGLLHDVGKLVILNIPDYLDKTLELSKADGISFMEAEYKLFNTSHAEIGAYLLGLWGFPEDILEVIANHHYPSKTEILLPNSASILGAVHLANYFTITGRLDLKYLEKLKIDKKLDEYWIVAEKVREMYEPKNSVC